MVPSSDGLWQGVTTAGRSGVYNLLWTARDGAGHEVTQPFGKAQVGDNGSITNAVNRQPVANAEITVYTYVPADAAWQVWDAGSWGQSNPQRTVNSGKFGFVLPPGRYYLQVKAPHYQTYTTSSFSIDTPTTLAPEVTLRQAWWPDWSAHAIDIQTDTRQVRSSRTGQAFPEFKLPAVGGGSRQTIDFRGRPTLYTFVATWAPDGQAQIAELAALAQSKGFNIVPVFCQQSALKAAAYLTGAGYNYQGIADADGTLSAAVGVAGIPFHYLTDNTGRITKVLPGFQTKETLLKEIGGN
jgi:peroxiredoxin